MERQTHIVKEMIMNIGAEAADTAKKTVLLELQTQGNTYSDVAIKVREAVFEVHCNYIKNLD